MKLAEIKSKIRSSGFNQIAMHFGNMYYVPSIWKAVKDLPIIEIPVAAITAVNAPVTLAAAIDATNVPFVDVSYPIILDQRGIILDGRHRWTKAREAGIVSLPCKIIHTDDLKDCSESLKVVQAVLNIVPTVVVGVLAYRLVKKMKAK